MVRNDLNFNFQMNFKLDGQEKRAAEANMVQVDSGSDMALVHGDLAMDKMGQGGEQDQPGLNFSKTCPPRDGDLDTDLLVQGGPGPISGFG